MRVVEKPERAPTAPANDAWARNQVALLMMVKSVTPRMATPTLVQGPGVVMLTGSPPGGTAGAAEVPCVPLIAYEPVLEG